MQLARRRIEGLAAFALAAALAVWAAPTVAQPAPQSVQTEAAPSSDVAGDALARYVAKPDASYSWEIHGRYRAKDAEVLELLLQSQTWQGGAWKHQMLLIKPRRLAKPDHALLIVGGGRWRDSYTEPIPADEALPEEGQLFVALAKQLESVIVVVGQVPYQPLFDLTEDKLIAYSFAQYMKSGDAEWPLLLPMVKSVVRALDASDAAARQEWRQPLRTFTVFGGSKRGWATWLTAAVEPRVTALAPTVIDALNMAKHFPHQTEAWGAPSEAIRPYTDRNLPEILASERGAPLRAIVDPYSHRDAIRQPKLIVIATNDEYFPLDSLNFYWDGLEGPKYVLYVPNEPHSIKHYGRVFRALRALHESAAGGDPLPKLEWQYAWTPDGDARLCVRSTPKAGTVRLWTATSEDRDFRNDHWSAGAEAGGRAAVFPIARPAAGYVAVFAEADYGHLLRAYSLSTNLAVLEAPSERAYGTRPSGVAGVCPP